jgi:hypothetical protein
VKPTPKKPQSKRVEEIAKEEQNDFVLNDQKETQVNTNSDQSSKGLKEDLTPPQEEEKEQRKSYDEKKFDDDLCNQVD